VVEMLLLIVDDRQFFGRGSIGRLLTFPLASKVLSWGSGGSPQEAFPFFLVKNQFSLGFRSILTLGAR